MAPRGRGGTASRRHHGGEGLTAPLPRVSGTSHVLRQKPDLQRSRLCLE